jgi:hypothetical protein
MPTGRTHMKIRKKNKILNKKVIKFSIMVIIALFFLKSVFFAGIPADNAYSGSRAPKTIWGYVTFYNESVAVGAYVVVSATGYPDETDTTDSLGAYQVDIGSDTGTEWPDGTPFMVTATLGNLSGGDTGIVEGYITRFDITIYPSTLIKEVTIFHSNPMDNIIGWENITCNVTNPIGVHTVKINITYPDDTKYNITMTKQGDIYYYNTTFSIYGNYCYFIWANDTYDNKNTSSVYYFLMPPNYDIDSDGFVNIMDINLVALLFGSIIDPPGSIREDIDNDGFINIMDINLVALHFGETWI